MMRVSNWIKVSLLGWLLVGACGSTQPVQNISDYHGKRPRNIILLIGDGMGIGQITAGMYSNDNYLHLERFPVIGLIKTTSADDLITDSAAGATAFSTGKKTYNGAIGVDADTVPQPTILEIAESQGMLTGLVATSEIIHATPASFIAHQYNRLMYEEIAEDFLATEVDLLIGGGMKYFLKRRDKRNLLLEMRENNYFVRNEQFPLRKLEVPPSKKLAYFTANQKPERKEKGRDYLPDAADFATKFLSERSGNRGFFLMIEGSQIDWGGHANDQEYIVSEMLDFDETVGRVLDFAEQDRHTLVIVTADHETGGFAINRGSEMGELKTGFTTGGHTSNMVPVFAFGPGAELFAGIYDNTQIFHRMMMAYGFSSVEP
jgi:alkaline phosphatase